MGLTIVSVARMRGATLEDGARNREKRASAIGRNGIRLLFGLARPRSTGAPATNARDAHSAMSRDLPTPGSPVTNAAAPRRSRVPAR